MNYPFYLAENLTPVASAGNLGAFIDLVERNFATIMNTRGQTSTVKWLRVVQLQAHVTRAILRAGGKPHDLFTLSQSYLEQISRIRVKDREALVSLLVEFSREAFQRLPGLAGMPPGVAQRFLSSLEECSLDTASVKELAQRLRVTPSHLCRAVQKATGRTPTEHIRRVKLTRAKRQLSTGSVTRTALDAGFGKVSTFIALFRREYGETPGTYKRRLCSG